MKGTVHAFFVAGSEEFQRHPDNQSSLFSVSHVCHLGPCTWVNVLGAGEQVSVREHQTKYFPKITH